MVTLIKIEHEVNSIEKAFNIFGDFEDAHEIPLFDRLLCNYSECNKYEYLYVFLLPHEVTSLINIIRENGLYIFEVSDFTNQFVNVLMNNDISEFENNFEEYYDVDGVVEYFYKTEVTVDMVLDKANKLGFSELNKYDYNLLKQKNPPVIGGF